MTDLRQLARGRQCEIRARRQLTLMRTSALLHEEHSTVDIPGGLYDLPRQVEWTDQDEPRQVAD